MNIFTILFFQPLYNILIFLYDILGNNLGLAIIAIAVLFRLVLIPITLRQIKMAETGKEMQEKINAIKKKHKKNKEKQQEEMVKVQQEYLPGQIAGCLPMILQFIIFINLYNVIRNIIDNNIDGYREFAYSFAPTFSEGYDVGFSFFGLFNLNETASSVLADSGVSLDLLPYVLLILLVGISQFGSMRILTAMRNTGKEEEKKPKKKDGEPEDFSAIVQQSTKQTMYLLPLMIMFFAFNLPSGLSIYWITQSGFVIIWQLVLAQLKKQGYLGGEELSKVEVK